MSDPQRQRPPSSTPSTASSTLTPKSSNSVVLESILGQLDKQDETIKVLQRSAKVQRDTTTRHEELIQQQQLLISNLLQQQASLFTMVSNVNDKQQQQQQQQQAMTVNHNNGIDNNDSPRQATSTPIPTTTQSNDLIEAQQHISNLTTKITLRDQQIVELLAKQKEDQQTIQMINQGYQQQSQEIDKLNQTIQKLKTDLQIAQSEVTALSAQKSDATSTQVIKLKPVYETLDQQLKRLETNIQQNSKTGIQLIIKTLVGRATIIECDISETIAAVKTKISEQSGIPLRDQILLRDGKELPNDQSILQLNLLNQTTLHLILKNRGFGQ